MPDDKKTYHPADLSGVTRHSIRLRANKTEIGAFGKPTGPAADIGAFFDSLPDLLKARDIREFMDAVVLARRDNRPFHLMLGAHTIKVGLAPIIIDLMRQGIVTGVSFNGAGLIHDLELAFFGGTSEDVQKGLADGSFGMVEETGDFYAAAVSLAAKRDIGLGRAGG
ncbi:MAG: hypothetical protein KKA42_09775, partial [candidate division Zixibacteria bacterium]|nr:hypothetical protein [candidate division Zixibacteria bacterium]